MNTGVYMIKNMITGRVYIGSAAYGFKKRWHSGYNNYLKSAFKKYGKRNFEFIPIQYCSPEDCIKNEQWWLDKLLFAQEYIETEGKDKRFLELSYNFNPTAGSSLGFKHSKETRLLISKNGLGNQNSLGNKNRAKYILQINSLGEIKEYESVKSAAKDHTFGYSPIFDVLKGRRDSYKGFVWKYKEI